MPTPPWTFALDKNLSGCRSIVVISRVECVLVCELSAMHWLIESLDPDSHGRLAFFANWNSLVLAFNGCSGDQR